MDGLLNKTITISSLELKAGVYGKQAKIKDEKGLIYNVYETKADGSTSVAWDQLQYLEVGDAVQIGYSEQDKKTPEGKPYIARAIRNFDKDIGNGVKNHQATQIASRPESPRGEASSASGGVLKGDLFWDKKAYKQCLWNYWLESRNGRHVYQILSDEEKDLVWGVFNQIEQDAEKRFNPSPLKQAIAKSNPKFFSSETDSIDDVPFFDEEADLGFPF